MISRERLLVFVFAPLRDRVGDLTPDEMVRKWLGLSSAPAPRLEAPHRSHAIRNALVQHQRAKLLQVRGLPDKPSLADLGAKYAVMRLPLGFKCWITPKRNCIVART
jgi:hypothetical protein